MAIYIEMILIMSIYWNRSTHEIKKKKSLKFDRWESQNYISSLLQKKKKTTISFTIFQSIKLLFM